MPKHGKKYRELKAKVTEDMYTLADAVKLLKETNPSKFDASCELHMRLGVDPRHADQTVRATVALPHGTGKKLRVIAIVGEDQIAAVKEVGAMEVGSEDLIDKIAKGFTDFDVAVATPAMMPKLGKVAKTLGQKGLMPSPKAGTVSDKPVEVVAEIIKGKVEFRTDKTGIIHNIFGKVSFGEEQLLENLKTLIKAIQDEKPSGVKGTYIKAVHLATTMGPSITIDIKSL